MNPDARSRHQRSRKRRSWSDDRLIRACLDGDVDAWTELLDRYSGLLFSIGLQIGLKNDDAADLLQNVSMILLDHLGSLRSSESLSAWIITVTRREALRVVKREQRRAIVQSLVDDPIEEAASDEQTDDLTAKLVALHEQQLVREAMDRLPERCRRMLELLFVQDPPASYAEVAARMGVPIGSVGPTRARCLERLRKLLHDMGF
ncbi:MAG: sigma-70 family RNA polymerase sigma factor [Chthonomonadales bacterium]|nr:sigma-70 family RNA polymerase sigma factor [Chthonomonadales bacterium]